MIITKKVKVFSKYVDIKDLSLNSHKRVLVQCDICGIQKENKYNDYNKVTKNQTELYYCFNCKHIKAEKTCLEKYGDKNYTNVEKYKKTCLEKYGVDNVSKLKEVKEKKKRTVNRNFGVEHQMYFEETKNKIKKTCLEKYGTEYPTQSEIVKNKTKKTCLKKYGTERACQSEIVKNKIKQTFLEKYGVSHPMSIENVFNKQQEQIKNNMFVKKHYNESLHYQGSYEYDFLEHMSGLNKINDVDNGPTIKYFYDNNAKRYYSDFYIKDINLIVEIKSSYTYEAHLNKNLAKQKECINQGYSFIFIIDKDYSDLNIILNSKL